MSLPIVTAAYRSNDRYVCRLRHPYICAAISGDAVVALRRTQALIGWQPLPQGAA
jgi:hypothetical protein